ncbi:hypothetical protein BaRGS_00004687 [Batillaria attramentaria]|uniref:Uncharacterized protein n=1 Tax=Batillaria attramentaria TaxID=370345 RepID=A0ABD0LXQ9_9CAEN
MPIVANESNHSGAYYTPIHRIRVRLRFVGRYAYAAHDFTPGGFLNSPKPPQHPPPLNSHPHSQMNYKEILLWPKDDTLSRFHRSQQFPFGIVTLWQCVPGAFG